MIRGSIAPGIRPSARPLRWLPLVCSVCQPTSPRTRDPVVIVLVGEAVGVVMPLAQ